MAVLLQVAVAVLVVEVVSVEMVALVAVVVQGHLLVALERLHKALMVALETLRQLLLPLLVAVVEVALLA